MSALYIQLCAMMCTVQFHSTDTDTDKKILMVPHLDVRDYLDLNRLTH